MPIYRERAIRFLYRGADEITRRLDVGFSWASSVAPCTRDETVARFDLKLEPQESKALEASWQVSERSQSEAEEVHVAHLPRTDIRRYREDRSREWLTGFATAQSRDIILNDALERSLTDIRMLRSSASPVNASPRACRGLWGSSDAIASFRLGSASPIIKSSRHTPREFSRDTRDNAPTPGVTKSLEKSCTSGGSAKWRTSMRCRPWLCIDRFDAPFSDAHRPTCPLEWQP